jgi:hypothetical protein
MVAFAGGAFGGGDLDLTNVGVAQAVALGSGKKEVAPGYMKSEGGNLVLDEQTGLPIYLEPPQFLQDVDGEWTIDEVTNKKILMEGSSYYINGLPHIGSVTPLSSISLPCIGLTLSCPLSNKGPIRAGGPEVKHGDRLGRGTLIYPGQSASMPDIADVKDVFIHGWVTDVVDYSYGISESEYLGDTDEFTLTDTDGFVMS